MAHCLLAADFAQSNHALVILSLFAVGIGLFFILTPAQHILQSDRRTAYWLYRSELEFSGDKRRAVAAATYFYRFFGGVVVAIGISIFCLAFL